MSCLCGKKNGTEDAVLHTSASPSATTRAKNNNFDVSIEDGKNKVNETAIADKRNRFRNQCMLKSRRISNPALELIEKRNDLISFKDCYRTEKKLGEGNFSVVNEVTNLKTKQKYAAKILTKARMGPSDLIALRDEISILQELDEHPNIVVLHDFFHESDHYYLITELMKGGELFDRIVTKEFYSEKEARDVCQILFEAVQYCHSKKVAHRDLKPNNLLLVSRNDDLTIKIADFGFAKRVIPPEGADEDVLNSWNEEKCLRTACGTPEYVAPEVLSGVPYGTKADMWSLGVIMFTLLGGYPPFHEDNQVDLFRKIAKGDYEFYDEYWSEVSDEAKSVISGLLIVNPAFRLSAEAAMNDPWTTGSDELLESHDLRINLDHLRRYNAKRKIRQAVLTLIATNKITSLGAMFRANNSLAHQSQHEHEDENKSLCYSSEGKDDAVVEENLGEPIGKGDSSKASNGALGDGAIEKKLGELVGKEDEENGKITERENRNGDEELTDEPKDIQNEDNASVASA